MKKKVRDCRLQFFLSTLALFFGLTELVRAREVTVNCLVTYEIKDGIYVDKGTDDGLRQNISGSMRFGNGNIQDFEVLYVTKKTALLKLVNTPSNINKLAGQSVQLIFEQTLSNQDSNVAQEKSATDTTNISSTNDDKFVPLLAPAESSKDIPKVNNIFHGQINIKEMFQKDNQDSLDYSVTHIGSSGSLDRFDGSRWSLEWSGDISYRDGDAYRYNPDYKDPRLDLYMLSLQHPLGEDGLFRFGRFIPRELPGIGYVDGALVQVRPSEFWRIGTVAGFKPDRYDLSPSGDEPLAAVYGTFEAGERKSLFYSGTAGILGSLYKGQTDRLALLFDQRMDVGSSFSVNSTAQVDLDVGSAEYQTGTRLTRLDVSAIYRIYSGLNFRSGIDHWERPDNQAERDLLVIDDERLFDDGYWRYWVGSDQDLFWKLRLSEQISFIESSEYDYDPRWSIGLTRTGLLSLSDASATATIFNLQSQSMDGYGIRLSAYLPFLNHKLSVQPAAGFRTVTDDSQSEDFSLSYMSLNLNGKLSSNWTLFGGFTQTYGDNVDSYMINLGLRFSW
jgi:hypothetical protein